MIINDIKIQLKKPIILLILVNKDQENKSDQGRSGRRKARPRTTQIDVQVGSRVNQRRILCGFSLEGLARELGLSFQQVQKYERGTNRISASRIYQIGQVLKVPVGYFFEGIAADKEDAEKAAPNSEEISGIAAGNFSRKETLELIRIYYRITNKGTRRSIVDLMKVLASGAVLPTIPRS